MRNQWWKGVVLLCVVFLGAPPAAARNAQAPPAKVCRAHRIDTPPAIDGKLNDAAWSTADWHGNFTQRDPDDGAEPTVETQFKLVYDDEALYFAFRMHDDPEAVSSILARRDWFPGDWIEVNIDSYHDFRTAFSFTLSLSGTRGDEFISNDGDNWDTNWNPIWRGATKVDEQGWTAEMKIPLNQLRFGSAEEQVWGLQVHRRLFRKEERSTWQHIPKDVSGWVSNFGEIHGLRGLDAPRRIEILPYSVAKTERFEQERDNPYRDGSLSRMDVGLDGNIGLTSDLTLDFTVNPDFGQVEADPSEVNLSAFETFFREQRPFFVEGADIFELPMAPAITGGHFTSDRLFYSRRIGKRPSYRLRLGEEEFADAPEQTSILGAVKLSGKTSGGLSVGILESVTAEEQADITDPSGEHRRAVEPLTNYFVGRVMQDFDGGNTVVGGMLTAVNRNIEDEHLEFLAGSAYAGGLDFRHYFHGRDYHLEARVFGSHVRGDEEAIDRLQTSSARYFQRPDNNHTTYDTTRTSISGSAGSLLLTRTSNAGDLRFQTGAAWRSPGFEVNDLGYMRRADELNQSTWVGYRKRNPFFIFNYWNLNANQWLDWDWGGNFLGAAVNTNTNWQFKNRWGGYWGVTRNFAQTSNTVLRGGPSAKWPGATEVSTNWWTDSSRDVRGELGAWVYMGDNDAFTSWQGSASVTVRPTNALQLRASPGFTRDLTDLQYVSTKSIGDEDRYVFAHLDQRTFSVTFRVDYCITPNLTLQYYGEPFVSAGRYGSFKRITDPQAGEYADRFHTFTPGEITYDESGDEYNVDEDGNGSTDYSIGNPEFNVRDFNSNLVLRWEYLPGSTLFLVWSQSRFDFAQRGDFRLRHDVDSLFETHPHNVFLVKFNRRFSL